MHREARRTFFKLLNGKEEAIRMYGFCDPHALLDVAPNIRVPVTGGTQP